MDSSPHFCDNKTDLIRTARSDLARKPFFGTRPFPRRNVCADFDTVGTDFDGAPLSFFVSIAYIFPFVNAFPKKVFPALSFL